jgi:ketosteroid isomerase-like protein
MSQGNVEIVRRVYEAAAQQDSEAVLALYDPQVELDSTRLQIVGEAGAVHHGHEGMRRFFREWHDAWENIEYDYDELIDAGHDKVVSVVTRRARGRASGAEVELRVALVWTLTGGKVARVVWFPSRDEALQAAGFADSQERSS